MYLSIDIGGTKTLLALFSPHGICLKRFKFPTSQDPTAFSKLLAKNLQTFLPSQAVRHRVRAITVAIPGIVKLESNIYSFRLGNLNWPDIDLVSPIKNLFSCDIFFVNDASLATLYEATRPGRRNGKSIYLTFSTGIGGGIAKNGHLSKASDTFEPGHVKYKFQGQSLEWEDIASAKALITAYRCSTLQDITLDNTTLEDLLARLSLGLVDIIKQESPSTIIIGGPLCFLFNQFKNPLMSRLRSEIKYDIEFKKARRPTESVIYGAFLYSKQNHGK
ncbi:ROK family protein [Candidatus Saccharibacteria bacterium]|nr:ROK family protein [Candidatus Saccharibacteria bacterium]